MTFLKWLLLACISIACAFTSGCVTRDLFGPERAWKFDLPEVSTQSVSYTPKFHWPFGLTYPTPDVYPHYAKWLVVELSANMRKRWEFAESVWFFIDPKDQNVVGPWTPTTKFDRSGFDSSGRFVGVILPSANSSCVVEWFDPATKESGRSESLLAFDQFSEYDTSPRVSADFSTLVVLASNEAEPLHARFVDLKTCELRNEIRFPDRFGAPRSDEENASVMSWAISRDASLLALAPSWAGPNLVTSNQVEVYETDTGTLVKRMEDTRQKSKEVGVVRVKFSPDDGGIVYGVDARRPNAGDAWSQQRRWQPQIRSWRHFGLESGMQSTKGASYGKMLVDGNDSTRPIGMSLDGDCSVWMTNFSMGNPGSFRLVETDGRPRTPWRLYSETIPMPYHGDFTPVIVPGKSAFVLARKFEAGAEPPRIPILRPVFDYFNLDQPRKTASADGIVHYDFESESLSEVCRVPIGELISGPVVQPGQAAILTKGKDDQVSVGVFLVPPERESRWFLLVEVLVGAVVFLLLRRRFAGRSVAGVASQ